MKRKFKLFATVASLCLSVALMAFGVYAATQVTYTVSGNVSFTAHVDAKFTAGIYTATGGAQGNLWDTTGYTNEYDPKPTDETAASSEWQNANVVFTASKTTAIYRITCTNEGSQTLYLHFATTDTHTLADQTDKLTVTIKVGTNTSGTDTLGDALTNDFETLKTTQGEVAADATYVIEIEVKLTDVTATLDSTKTTLGLKITADYTNSKA